MSALVDVTEKEWDAQLFGSRKGLAPTLGWKLCYHTLRSKGSVAGFPDRVLVRERVIYAELKTERGSVSWSQAEWLDGLARAGAEVYLWRPSDLEEISEVLSKRWLYLHRATGDNCLALPGGEHFVKFYPKSLWRPNEDQV